MTIRGCHIADNYGTTSNSDAGMAGDAALVPADSPGVAHASDSKLLVWNSSIVDNGLGKCARPTQPPSPPHNPTRNRPTSLHTCPPPPAGTLRCTCRAAQGPQSWS